MRSVLLWYTAATACCLIACLSNAVGAVIPLLITAWDLLTLAPSPPGQHLPTASQEPSAPELAPRGGSTWRHVIYRTAAMWLIGCLTVAAKQAGSQQDAFVRQMDAQSVERMAEVIEKLGYGTELVVGEVPGWSSSRAMLVLNVLWLNVKSLAWPAQLAISYEPVAIRTFRQAGVLLGLAAAGAFGALLLVLRRHPLPLFAIFWFGLALTPTSQILHHHIHRADRFLYLPLVGLAAAMGFGIRPLGRFLNHRGVALALPPWA